VPFSLGGHTEKPASCRTHTSTVRRAARIPNRRRFKDCGELPSRRDARSGSLTEMTLVRLLGLGCAIVIAGVASTAAAFEYSVAVGCKPETGKQIVDSRDYRFTLLVGHVENMYMPRQVRASHPKQGEEMLRGYMTPTAMLLAAGPIRHLEVQICVRTTRAVVTNAWPKIAVEDTTNGKTLTLPISVMEGIGEGVADLHYGNNLPMPASHRYIVTVTWRGERAIFHFVPSSPRHRR
jgi:hypothetical protein